MATYGARAAWPAVAGKCSAVTWRRGRPWQQSRAGTSTAGPKSSPLIEGAVRADPSQVALIWTRTAIWPRYRNPCVSVGAGNRPCPRCCRAFCQNGAAETTAYNPHRKNRAVAPAGQGAEQSPTSRAACSEGAVARGRRQPLRGSEISRELVSAKPGPLGPKPRATHNGPGSRVLQRNTRQGSVTLHAQSSATRPWHALASMENSRPR